MSDEVKSKEEMKQQEEKIDIKKEIFSWIRLIAIVIVVVFVIKQFVIVNAIVPSSSMENLIEPGDRLIGFRLSYITEDPKRYDVVIFKYPVDESQKYIKRVIGLPGETVEIKGSKIYIDGEETALDEPYLKEAWTIENNGYVFQVPEDCYLMLGDNRNVSLDARYWADEAIINGLASNEDEAEVFTYVKRDEILGKAIFKYWPSIETLTATDLQE